jgi:tRNA threonylcarbamoyl adenosine modification protein YeaZ
MIIFDTDQEGGVLPSDLDGPTPPPAGAPNYFMTFETGPARWQRKAEVDALVVGTGPGSFTGTRIGLAVARGLALALDLPAAGVSTLDALAAAAAGVLPVVDARRGEVFVPGPRAVAPDGLGASVCGVTCVGDGARRYRSVLERAGAVVPPDASPLHVPRASLHAALAVAFGPAEAILPVYGRVPDAVRSLA